MKHTLNIPDFLNDKLAKSKYNKLVEDVLAYYSDWIARNDTIFFREYTDHGIEHLESLLETSELLLTPDSKKLFSDSDACLLVISTILHDVALHLQESQFISLVSKDSYQFLNADLDTLSWHSLWVRFSAEATRFSESQLMMLFGTDKPIPTPDLNKPETWTALQYQLIGEFLRRHHPRLAHDFAIFGFPVIDEELRFLKVESAQFKKFIDLSGLVARSHGTSIRTLFPYLESRFSHLRIQDGTHSVFIMTILRIADFLQLQPSRAPKGQMIVKNLRSPLSRREWGVHAAIENIIYDHHQDPETVEVIVDSSKVDINLFLRLQSLLKYLQEELDYSWAVLGEVFGRFKEHKLGLTIRRVRSNIDDTNKFGTQAGFVPKKATFTAADAELLKLFIKPLYGDRPEISVRELIQNSVDAVRERLLFEPSNTDLLNKPSVSVSINKKDSIWSLIVEDQGIGMNLHTITDYFLNAGASFRLSSVWKENFLDKEGKAKVLRSGRFGVGALAAFMLSDDPTEIEMTVLTRHISSSENGAFRFSSKLSDKPIQIEYAKKKEPGTRIEITTKNPAIFLQESNKKDAGSSWDWFCLDKPILERFSQNGKRLTQKVTLPSSIETSNDDYHWIQTEDYESIGWSYSDYPDVVCNGIIVVEGKNKQYFLEESIFLDKNIQIKIPSLSIFDKDGNLPITLDRLRIEYDQLQFLGALTEDVKFNLLAFLLVTAPTKLELNSKYQGGLIKSHPAIEDSINKIPWILNKNGSTIYCPELIHILSCKSIIEVSDKSFASSVSKLVQDYEKIAFAIDTPSLWDNFKKKSTGVNGGSRVKVNRRKVKESEVDRILDLLEITSQKNRHRLSQRAVDKINHKYGIDRRDSPARIFDIMTEELMKKDIAPSYIIHDLEKLFREDLIGTDDFLHVIQLLDERSSARRIQDEISRLLESERTRDRYEYRKRRSFHRDEFEHRRYELENELEYVLRESALDRRDLERIHDRVRRKIRNLEFEEVDIDFFERIFYEIRKLSDLPPDVKLEKFGKATFKIDWEKAKSSNYKEKFDSTPISEIQLTDSFSSAVTNNLLAKIWLDNLGDQLIPFDSKDRVNFIKSLKDFKKLERHVNHWKSAVESK